MGSCVTLRNFKIYHVTSIRYSITSLIIVMLFFLYPPTPLGSNGV